MSPQTRRGRATTASRKARGRADAGPNSQPIDESPRGEGPAEAPVESRPRSEGKRAKVPPERRKKQHGTAYRWIRAYLPILALLFALLGVVWVYTSFINPPPPTPAQQWARIEAKWSPARERARQAIAADTLDFAKQQTDYKDFYTQTKGWVDAVAAVKDWGVGANDVTTFLSDGQLYVGGLEQINAMKTANDVAALSATISQSDSAFTADVLLIKADFKLSVTGPTAPPLAFPSVNPTPTGVPGASGSAAPSAGPSTSAAPAAISSPTPSPSAVASPTSSPS